MQSAWKETIAGGTPQAERAEFEQLARDIMKMQLKNAKTASAHGVPHTVDRTLHAKTTLATDRAELRFRDDLPTDLSHGFAQPDRAYPAVVRFSNAASTVPGAGLSRYLTARVGPQRIAPRLQYFSVATLRTVRRLFLTFRSIRQVCPTPNSLISRSTPRSFAARLPVMATLNVTNWRASRAKDTG